MFDYEELDDKPPVLSIEPGVKGGHYKFSIDGVDVTPLITEGVITFYYGELDDDRKQCRLQVGATFRLPERYKMIVHKAMTNGDGG